MWDVICKFINAKAPDIIIGLVIGFFVPFTTFVFAKLGVKIKNFIYVSANKFSLSGTWQAHYASLINPAIQVYETVFIKQKSERLGLRIHQFIFENEKQKSAHVFFGEGIIKSGKISIFYYATESSSNQTGVITLEIKNKTAQEPYLMGCFYEIDDRKEDKGIENYPKDYYKLYRVKMNLLQKVKMKLYKKKYVLK